MSKKILNYRHISRKLTGNDFTIRSNFVPKNYKEKITELENLVDGWESKNIVKKLK